ncbi:MAG: hypothetical protein JNK05_19135 [Myxococcales bacterium]|nr:hypothetical protein [Myxococcales bacterium]
MLWFACLGGCRPEVPSIVSVEPANVVLPRPTPCDPAASVWPDRDATPPAWGSGRTITYAVSTLQIDRYSGEGATAAGFDLDSNFYRDWRDGPCGGVDALSDLDCDSNCAPDAVDRDGGCSRRGCLGSACVGGVDNNLPEVINYLNFVWGGLGGWGSDGWNFDLRRVLYGAYRSGEAALVVQISGVDSLENDDEVAVRLVAAVGLYARTTRGDCDPTVVDQRYAIAPRAVIAGDPSFLAVRDGVGRVRAGRLRARFSRLVRFPFVDVDSSVRDLEIEDARLAVDLRETHAINGNFGGGATMDSLVPLLTSPGPDYQPLRGVAGWIDLPTREGRCATSTDCSFGSARLSVGVRFKLARAILEPRVLDAPTGVCPPRDLVPPYVDPSRRFDAGSFCSAPDAGP